MSRLVILGVLGCSFLSVQAHVMRERAARRESQITASHSAGGEHHGTVPGGGTTRAIGGAPETPGQPAALASAAPQSPVATECGGIATTGGPPAASAHATGRPILRI